MRRRRGTLPVLWLAVALVGSACTVSRSRAVAVVPAGALARPDDDGKPPAGPRGARAGPRPARREARRGPTSGGTSLALGRTAAGAVHPTTLAATEGDPGPAGSSLDGPVASASPTVKRSLAPVAHERVSDVETLERRRRETFLDATTVVRADKATLFVPPRYLVEAVVEGPTRLTLRRLTVEGIDVRLVARTDGAEDISLSARGRVSFRADLAASVLEEEGLRTLLLRNDQHTPLR